jgi:hypothetical protein
MASPSRGSYAFAIVVQHIKTPAKSRGFLFLGGAF